MKVGDLAATLRDLPASAGETVLVGIDGFSGAGKTELARALSDGEEITSLSIEAFYLGWTGLAAGVERARSGLVEPLQRGETPRWRGWDWTRGEDGLEQEHSVTTRILLLEGCGAAATALRHSQALTIWVHAEERERERRLWARADWAEYAPHRPRWQRQEQALAAREGLPRAADAVVEWRSEGSLAMRTSPHR
jgi:hypothetical protein